MVGNGCTNWAVDCGVAYAEMAYWHGLYDDATYNAFQTNSCEAYFSRYSDPMPNECVAPYVRFNLLTSNINIYDVYGKCWTPDGKL